MDLGTTGAAGGPLPIVRALNSTATSPYYRTPQDLINRD